MKALQILVVPLIGFAISLPARADAAPAGDLESAKALYASASYEEALSTLNAIADGPDTIQVNQYRALCLVALGRTEDARTPLRAIVMADPLYTVATDEVSPRLVDLFRDVRASTLPEVARAVYLEAKDAYDAQHASDAIAQFKALLSILADPAMPNGTSDVIDLKDLAEGFLAVAEAKVAAAQPADPPPAADPQPPPQVPDLTHVYSSADTDVRPPIAIARAMPPWSPPPALGRFTRTGSLNVVISEAGAVESASLAAPISPYYDDALLEAAKSWRYRPALFQGTPVKYELTLDIVLRPDDGRSARE